MTRGKIVSLAGAVWLLGNLAGTNPVWGFIRNGAEYETDRLLKTYETLEDNAKGQALEMNLNRLNKLEDEKKDLEISLPRKLKRLKSAIAKLRALAVDFPKKFKQDPGGMVDDAVIATAMCSLTGGGFSKQDLSWRGGVRFFDDIRDLETEIESAVVDVGETKSKIQWREQRIAETKARLRKLDAAAR